MRQSLVENLEIVRLHELSDDRRRREHLIWWAQQTQSEKHMVDETHDSLAEKLIEAFLVLSNEKIVAASGIFPARTKEQKDVFFEEKRVVELGSNVVSHEWRNHGIAKILVQKRLEASILNNWFPVSVTTNPSMQNILRKCGGVPMDEDSRFRELRSILCICHSYNPECTACPLQMNGGWVFLND